MKKIYYSLLFICILFNSAFAQPTVLYSSINTTARVAMVDLGLFKQGRIQANQSGFQRWAFHVGTVAVPDYGQNWRIGSTPNVLSFNNFIPVGFSNGANYFSGGAGIDGELNGIVNGNYYTFNIMKNGAASSDMELLETNFNPTIISTVAQTPLAASVIANSPVAVTITIANTLAMGEYVYLRYSTNAFVSSSILQANFTGNTTTLNIPCQVAGTNLSYYVFSSNETLAGLQSDLAAFGNNCYDMATLNLNNNGGPNYTYTVAAPPASSIAYTGTPYCSNSGSANVTNNGTLGGTYSSTAGLSINAVTGNVNLASTTPGTYMVTYTIAPTGSCTTYTTTTSITVNPAPTASINYAGSPYCSNVTTAVVARTGTNGGIYASTTGLTINATTGEVNIATSTVGNYTVTYTIPAAGGCALFAATTNISITAAPTATISYGATPYCSNNGVANAVRTGSMGGIYSSAMGLSINSSTGAVTLATSTAGNYTVTYTIAAAAGCPTFTTTAIIIITAAPAATIAYTGSPYCSTGITAIITRTGNAGGVYTSTNGLVINSTTGDVDVAASTTGTYVVTYSIAANAGCAIFTTTANITINAISAVPISITASTTLICASSGLVTLTANGGTLGTNAVYKWYSNSCGGTPVGTGATLANVLINTTTTFFVRIEGTCNTTACQSVTINVAPQPVIELTVAPSTAVTPSAPATIVATVSPAANYTYLWTKNNNQNLTTNADRIIVQAVEVGNYKVKVTAPSGCTTTSSNVVITSAPSNTLFIIPNPNKGIFNVSYNNTTSNAQARTLNIYDDKGAIVFSQNYNANVPYSNMRVDISNTSKGIYIVQLIDATGKALASGKVLVF